MARATIRDMAGLFRKPWNTLIMIGVVAGVGGSLIGAIAVIVAAAVAGAPVYAVLLIVVVTLGFCLGIPAIVYLVFRSVLGPEVTRRDLLQNGEPAEATVISLSETGLTVNRILPVVDLELEVRRKGRQPYRVKSRFMVSRLNVPGIQPGAVIGVMVDPADPRTISLGTGAASPAAPTPDQQRGMEEWLKKLDDSNESIIAGGVGAAAEVLEATPLGIMVNSENPVMKFILEVQPGDRPAFKAEATACILAESVPKYQPGQTIHVKFDPNDATKVAVEHS